MGIHSTLLPSTLHKFPTIFSLHSLPVSLHIKRTTLNVDSLERISTKVFYFSRFPEAFQEGKMYTNQPNHESSLNNLYSHLNCQVMQNCGREIGLLIF